MDQITAEYWKELAEWTLSRKASDILFSKGKVFARINTDVVPYDGVQPIDMVQYDNLITSTVPTEYHLGQLKGVVGSADYAFEFLSERFRVNAYRELHGFAAACRPLPKRSYKPSEIGITDQLLSTVSSTSKGLILVTGPTGSGKSSTICTLIEHLNTNFRYNIVTIEDPIEYIFTPRRSIFQQREIGSHADSFATALRAAMRQAPNIIFVGEIRDLETAMAALQAAETGHLVFATLHTEQVAATISRIVEIAPHERQSEIRSILARNLKVAIGQRLLRKVGGGVVAGREIFINIPAAETLILRGLEKTLDTVMTTNRAMGMMDWETSLSSLYNDGNIDEETYRTNSTQLV